MKRLYKKYFFSLIFISVMGFGVARAGEGESEKTYLVLAAKNAKGIPVLSILAEKSSLGRGNLSQKFAYLLYSNQAILFACSISQDRLVDGILSVDIDSQGAESSIKLGEALELLCQNMSKRVGGDVFVTLPIPMFSSSNILIQKPVSILLTGDTNQARPDLGEIGKYFLKQAANQPALNEPNLVWEALLSHLNISFSNVQILPKSNIIKITSRQNVDELFRLLFSPMTAPSENESTNE